MGEGLTTSIILQFSAALFLGGVGALFCYRAPLKWVIIGLMLLIPFQLLENRFGTVNEAFAFLVCFIMLIRGEIRHFPLKVPMLLLLLAYFVSFSQVHPVQNVDHLCYLFALLSAISLFILIYNYTVSVPDYRHLITALHVLNLLVVLYCVLQAALGRHAKIDLMWGITISLVPPRTGGDNRLAGPFGSTVPGLLAEYMVISILLCFYDFVYSPERRRKIALAALVLANLGCLFATGNRGGLLAVFPFTFLLMYIVRHKLGVINIVKITTTTAILAILAGIVVVKYTSYNRLFDRLLETKVEEGVPDTRENTWPAAIELWKEKPWLGHGPRLKLNDEDLMWIPEHKIIDYPHDLYLYLMCTVGLVGLAAYVVLFTGLLARISAGLKNNSKDEFLANWTKLGLLIVFYILVDQIKIEFTRFTAIDFWHYLYMMFGLILGLSDRARGMQGLSAGDMQMTYQIINFRVAKVK